ncbi:protein of unknown function [Paenibacillus catalpae]|uniref:DUF4309 domain-containing protein n=1 Tax=Paenibacillus catalpae TaxID=1045775 RepID=A0A1I2BUB6_9BACL|nr:YjgB family protein [Paenibacillus catalpae]SFE58973.1 protein of unknown function [Paenibacillus catalpae]
MNRIPFSGMGFMLFMLFAASILILGGCGSASHSDNSQTYTYKQTPDPNPPHAAPPSPIIQRPYAASSTATAETIAKQKKKVQALYKLAKRGKMEGVKYPVHTTVIDKVEKDWGKPDKTVWSGKGNYWTYKSRKVIFGFNKGSQIFEVRSSDPELQKLTRKSIEQALGKPDSPSYDDNNLYYSYSVSETFQIKFAISKKKDMVNYVSVYAPKDAVNNMAGG